MKNVISNQKGQSLIGVMIAVGISGILMMTICDLTVLMTKNNTTALANSDILAYVNQLRMNIQDPVKSTAMVFGNTLNSTAPVLKDPMVANTIIGQAGMKPNGAVAWSIRRISFENPVTTGNNLYKFTLVVVTAKVQSMVVGPAIGRRVVGDVYCFVVNNVITTCTGGVDPVAQAKQQCGALGGTWVDAAAYGSQCQFRAVASVTNTTDDDKNKGDHNNDGHLDNGQTFGEGHGSGDHSGCSQGR